MIFRFVGSVVPIFLHRDRQDQCKQKRRPFSRHCKYFRPHCEVVEMKRVGFVIVVGLVLLLGLSLRSETETGSKDLLGIFRYRFGMSVSECQLIAKGALERQDNSDIPGLVEYSTDHGLLSNRDGSISNLPAGLCLSFYNGRLAGIIVELPQQEDAQVATMLVTALRDDVLKYYDKLIVMRNKFRPDESLLVLTLKDAEGDGLLLMWDGMDILLCLMTGELLQLNPEWTRTFLTENDCPAF